MNILDQTDEPKEYLSLMPDNLRDPEALAKKAYHADVHIKTLTTRLDELRNDYLKATEDSQTRAKLEDLISRLETAQQPASNNNPVNEVREPIDMNKFKDSILSEVPKAIGAYEKERRETENASTVVSKLKERFGDNYSNAVREQIADLGMSEDEFNSLARRSPKAILKTLGVEDTRRETFQAPVRSQSSFGKKAEETKTWSYYQQLKKENPKLYHDPKITNEMTAMAEQLGDAFYDGDWSRL